MNLYAYVQDDPVNWIDPMGLVRWNQFGSSLLGIAGNGLGVVVGSGLLATPEPTMGTKIIGGLILGKSVTGWGLNWYNLTQSLKEECTKYDAPSSATRAIASIVAPGSADAQRAADAVDLGLDFMSGRGAIRAYGRPSFPGVGNSVTRRIDPASNIFRNPTIMPVFQGTQVISIGADNISR